MSRNKKRTKDKKRIVVIGMGRQGWAIDRQLVKLWKDRSDYELYVYDKDRQTEDVCLPEHVRSGSESTTDVYEALRAGRVQKLRETSRELQIHNEIGDEEIEAAIISLEPDLLINASTFFGHKLYTRIAFEADCDYMDLGQDTEQARSQRDLDSTIQATGKTMRMVPECGLAPGLVNILGAWLLQQGGDSLQIRVGGLPMNTSKGGDLHYAVSWSPDGVIKEYTDETIAIKDGKLVRFEGLTSVADHEDPSNMAYGVRPLSIKDDALVRRFQSQQMQEFLAQNNETGVWEIVKLEARPTSDGISLMPFDSPFDKLRSLEYKTIRYHAHFDVVQGLIQGGHIEELKDLLRSAGSATPDLVLMRVWTEESGLPKAMVEGIVCGDLALDFATDDRKLNSEPDPIFSAMQHLTGWPTALVADALLSYKDTSGQARPSLFRQDHPLWSGRTLNSALHSGGVIMPYELVDGGQMLTALDRDYLIPHRQLSWSRAVPSSV